MTVESEPEASHLDYIDLDMQASHNRRHAIIPSLTVRCRELGNGSFMT